MASRTAGDADELYHSCAAQFGPALDRLASAYEADFDLRRDLLQEIHTALWRSFRVFDGRCSLRTWTFRVAHNIAASHVVRQIRHNSRGWVSLETVEALPTSENNEAAAGQRLVLDRLMALIQKLRPFDRQIFLLYLEGLDAGSIAEIAGVSPTNVTTKIHRIKEILIRQFREGGKGNAPGSICR